MDDNESFGLRVLERARNKRQSEAERIFSQYCKSESYEWQSPTYKRLALAILSSGIFKENELRGHARHKKNYPVDLDHLLFDLVETHLHYDLSLAYLHRDIIGSFDEYFDMMAGIARIGGVRESQIQRIKQTWREKISARVAQGKISPHWRHIIQAGRTPKEVYYRFADLLLLYAPQAPSSRIADWVNAILKSLGREPVSNSVLRDYVGKEQERIKKQPYVIITE